MLKNLPAIQETQVQSLGQEDPLEKDGNPLQYFCLENPMDRGDWWAIVHGVAKNWTHSRITNYGRCMSPSLCIYLSLLNYEYFYF